MSRLFPFRTPAEIQDESPRVLSLSGDEADDVFAALSSGTARALLAALYDEPRPTSEVADALDTSIQNARYHLGNLQEAGLVEVVDTWYSEQGNEMKVYAPTNGALVLFEGRPESRTTLRDAVTRLLGGVGVLALAALLIDRGADLFRGLVPSMGSSGGDAGGGAGDGGDLDGGGTDGGDGTTTTADDGGGDGDGAGDGGDVGDGGGAGDGGDGGTTTTEVTPTEPTETTAEATQTATQTTADGTPVDGTTTVTTQTSPEPTTVETTAATTQTYTTEATRTTVEATRTAAPAAEPATTTAVTTTLPPGTFEAVTGVPLTPGLAFFLGGLVVLLAGFAWWYHARGQLG